MDMCFPPCHNSKLHVVRASINYGHALMMGEDRKVAAHAEACHSVEVTFDPLGHRVYWWMQCQGFQYYQEHWTFTGTEEWSRKMKTIGGEDFLAIKCTN